MVFRGTWLTGERFDSESISTTEPAEDSRAKKREANLASRLMSYRGSRHKTYCCSSISTASPKWISSMAKTIIPVAVVGVVPMITISPTERRGMSAT